MTCFEEKGLNCQPDRGGRTLLSPLGLSPGLLYSALMTVKPSGVVVLTYLEVERSLEEIVARAGFRGEVAVVRVEVPFDRFHEAGRKVAEITVRALRDGEWVINLTGGTTALQFIVQRTGAELERKGYRVIYVVMVDRRGVIAQQENPWVVGR